MCGVTGFFSCRPRLRTEGVADVIDRMTATISHRGPDDDGTWIDAENGVAFGHRRLSVLDLTAAGHQPMVSHGGRYVITYNGEIYNAAAVAKELAGAGCRFRGHSDTEVLLAAVEQWGLDGALPRLNGMFAFALWDRQERRLQLARDRLGEKPLYYGWAGDTFLFGSELKALRAHPDFRAEIDRNVLALFFRHNCVPAPYCIYEGYFKLPPGTVLTLPTSAQPQHVVPEPYWSAREVADAGMADPFGGSAAELTDQLEQLLADAVALRMNADVPLGAFLSGGVDSSAVVAMMQAQSSRRIKTFTIGFEDPAYDESPAAAAVARHLDTDHVELIVSPDEAMELIPRLPALYDEPFSDSSQIPTHIVSRLARESVTVSLSGDGGDELFGGYNRYSWCLPLWRKFSPVPLGLRAGAETILGSLSPDAWDGLFRRLAPVLPPRLRVRNPGVKIQKVATVLRSTGLEDMYLRLASHWQEPAALVKGAHEPPSMVSNRAGWPHFDDPVARMMYLDLVTYLPDDILVKVDRASMGVSLEARVPMLDHRLVEFAWRVPIGMKLREGQGKWLLRQVLYRHVPKELIERPKAGFGLPVGDWLRGPLRDWAETLLAADRLDREGYLDADVVRTTWDVHLSGRRNMQEKLWDVLMFQSWIEQTACSYSVPACG